MIILNKKRNKGFIALISAVLISVILLLIATNLSLTSFYGRSNILDSELKERSSALAEACADTALLKLANNRNYVLVAADHNIVVGTGRCDIFSLSPNPPRTGNITIITKANYNNTYYTTLQIVINSTNTVVSWEEI